MKEKLQEQSIDEIETLLTYLVCSDSPAYKNTLVTRETKTHYCVDANSTLEFAPMSPNRIHTIQLNADRLYTYDPNVLIHSVQDTLEKNPEVAWIDFDDALNWLGFRKITKKSKKLIVPCSGLSLYEIHYRRTFPNGVSGYVHRVGAITRDGDAMPIWIKGSKGGGTNSHSNRIIQAASIIEDAYRCDVFTASIKESTEIILPVPIGEHKELFELREGPLTNAGKRKAIMHWVAKHMRETKKGNTCTVSKHLRGVNTFDIDGLTVTLTANTMNGLLEK